MEPVSVERGVSWLPAIRTIGAVGKRIAQPLKLPEGEDDRRVGRADGVEEVAGDDDGVGRCAMTPSIAARKAWATSASRWLMPAGVWRWYCRMPRWGSAIWASFTGREWSDRPRRGKRLLIGISALGTGRIVLRGVHHFPADPPAQVGGEEGEHVVRAACGGSAASARRTSSSARPSTSARTASVATRRSSCLSCRATASANGRSAPGGNRSTPSRPLSTAGRGKRTKIGWVKCGMAQHQLALGQRGELDLGGGRQRGVARRGQLVHVHAAEHRRARVADHPPLHLGAELLRREEHQPEVAAALGEVEQHLPHVGVGAVGRGVLVQLVHEHHHVVHAEVAPLEVLAQLGDARARRPGPAPADRRPATSTT